MNRKQFVQFAGVGAAVVATGGMTGCANNTPATSVVNNGARADKAVYVPNGKNRFKEELMIWGVIPLQIKISSKDTDGSFFLFEHARMQKGGPPRHFHYEQDEWFYAVEGEFAFEVGEEKFTLRPGDILLLHV
jgi:mannose-6-phosphate isomerase-like protein (cupin superfamily)